MKNLESGTQVTFGYVNGEVESFSLLISPFEFYQQLQAASEHRWLYLHLETQTEIICLDKVVKIEVTPPFPELEEGGSIQDVLRVTALQRAARH